LRGRKLLCSILALVGAYASSEKGCTLHKGLRFQAKVRGWGGFARPAAAKAVWQMIPSLSKKQRQLS
jgi:hypothetical protein